MLDLRQQTYGVEIEMTGLSREKAAKVVRSYFQEKAERNNQSLPVTTHIGGAYDSWGVKVDDGRTWMLERDSSIAPYGGYDNRVELVTPILKYEDMDDLQNLVRALRVGGAKVNNSCGIHVHVGAKEHDVKSLQRLVKLMASKEDLIYQALDILPAREENYTKKVDQKFLQRMLKEKPSTMKCLEDEWYDDDWSVANRHKHYNYTRYHGLNLHATFTKGTVEFRLFNATLHAGRVKAYVQFCLALNAMAINSKAACYKKVVTDNPKYTFRCFLLRLGLIGDEFKTCRHHMLLRLEGNSAWRDANH